MSEPIKVGDLVQVIRPWCCTSKMGLIFVVTEIHPPEESECSECGKVRPPSEAFVEDDDWSFFPSELKRIPPLEELEGAKTEEVTHA